MTGRTNLPLPDRPEHELRGQELQHVGDAAVSTRDPWSVCLSATRVYACKTLVCQSQTEARSY